MKQKIETTFKILKDKWIIQTFNSIYYYFKMKLIRKKLAYKYIKWTGIEIW